VHSCTAGRARAGTAPTCRPPARVCARARLGWVLACVRVCARGQRAGGRAYKVRVRMNVRLCVCAKECVVFGWSGWRTLRVLGSSRYSSQQSDWRAHVGVNKLESAEVVLKGVPHNDRLGGDLHLTAVVRLSPASTGLLTVYSSTDRLASPPAFRLSGSVPSVGAVMQRRTPARSRASKEAEVALDMQQAIMRAAATLHLPARTLARARPRVTS
jgi:hypothetical protein